MWPTYSALSEPGWARALRRRGGGSGGDDEQQQQHQEDGREGVIHRVLLANIGAKMLDWFRETLSLAVAPALPPSAPRGGLPPLLEEASIEGFARHR
jgi:hypothetical protein